MDGAHCRIRGARRLIVALLGALALAGITVPVRAAPSPGADRASAPAAARAPYPPSRAIRGIRWNFRAARPLRRAIGSDIWPCTWAQDDALYCAWGDGGGFDGNSNAIGRVSLGFARVTGAPRAGVAASFHGRNVWGAPPYAERRATFGGKVGTLIALDGAIYGTGSLWTRRNSAHPVATWEAGTLDRLIWSADRGRTWRIAPWTPHEDLGIFLNFGRGSANAPNGFVYAYYGRPRDPGHVYLKRVPARDLRIAPERSHAWQYLAFMSRAGDAVSWSPRQIDAVPVFTDPRGALGATAVYDAGLRRYLMTVGHDPSGRPEDAAPGELGVFVAPHPWGPWRTLYYGDDWGHFPASTRGDYLGLTFPVKWISGSGTRLWGVFSGPGPLDAFNLVEARLIVRGHGGHRAPAAGRAPALERCREHYNAVNRSVFMVCPGA